MYKYAISISTLLNKDLLEEELLRGDTIISRIFIRLTNLNFPWGYVPRWLKEFVRFDETDDGGIIGRYTHRKSYTPLDRNGDLKPLNIYEICLITNTPASIFINGTKEHIDALSTELSFVPGVDNILFHSYDEPFYSGFKKRFHDYRVNRGLTVEDVAKALGATAGTIQLFETRKNMHSQFMVTLENIKKLCALFGVDIDDLLLGPDPQRVIREWFPGREKKNAQCEIYPPVIPPEKHGLTVEEIMKCREAIIANLDKINVRALLRINQFIRHELEYPSSD